MRQFNYLAEFPYKKKYVYYQFLKTVKIEHINNFNFSGMLNVTNSVHKRLQYVLS